METNWMFEDLPQTASFTTTFVVSGAPILRVYHDFDGGWQFYGAPDDPVTVDVARIVSLASIISLDPTVAVLHDLPNGWRATRESKEAGWIRNKNNPFPTFAENGYYLENAVRMAEHRDDIELPPEEVRDNLPVGAYVKLLFRFAAEDAVRADVQTERMWVLITKIDEDGFYIGTLDNDPQHSQTLAQGDTIRFHPLHISAILDGHDA